MGASARSRWPWPIGRACRTTSGRTARLMSFGRPVGRPPDPPGRGPGLGFRAWRMHARMAPAGRSAPGASCHPGRLSPVSGGIARRLGFCRVTSALPCAPELMRPLSWPRRCGCSSSSSSSARLVYLARSPRRFRVRRPNVDRHAETNRYLMGAQELVNFHSRRQGWVVKKGLKASRPRFISILTAPLTRF